MTRIKARKARKHTHIHRSRGRDGKTRVARSIIGCRRIPGFHRVDPLSIPFRERESVVAKHARRTLLTLSEARVQLGAGGRLSAALATDGDPCW